MSLKPVSDLLHLVAQDDKIGTQNQLTLFQAMLESPKFRCLFTNSLEMDKYAFVGRLSEIVDDPECWVGARYGSRTDTKVIYDGNNYSWRCVDGGCHHVCYICSSVSVLSG